MSKTLHLVLQGKGGCGKSFVSTLLAQYLLGHLAHETLCIDTDPLNDTFHQFKALAVERLELCSGDRASIQLEAFDHLVETIFQTEAHHIVIDNGAASFLPLAAYLSSTGVIEQLAQAEIRTIIHCVVAGGPSFVDTLAGLDSLVEAFSHDAAIVAWVNEYFGAAASEGVRFESLPGVQKVKKKLASIVYLPRYRNPLFESDVIGSIAARKTLAQVIDDQGARIMTRQRLLIFKRELFAVLDASLFPLLDSLKNVAP
jgi:hypothetical protein